jgi:hypothetical protein
MIPTPLLAVVTIVPEGFLTTFISRQVRERAKWLYSPDFGHLVLRFNRYFAF